MPVKCEDALDLPLPQEDEGDAVGEADILIGELLEEFKRRKLLFLSRSQHLEDFGGINNPSLLGSKSASSPPCQQSECFIQHEVAGEATLLLQLKPIPKTQGPFVILIPAQVPGQKCPGVNEDHSSSP